jgi:hypothetical protein
MLALHHRRCLLAAAGCRMLALHHRRCLLAAAGLVNGRIAGCAPHLRRRWVFIFSLKLAPSCSVHSVYQCQAKVSNPWRGEVML